MDSSMVTQTNRGIVSLVNTKENINWFYKNGKKEGKIVGVVNKGVIY